MTHVLRNTCASAHRSLLTIGLLLLLPVQLLLAADDEQNAVVVVNGKSLDSRRIANEYIALRNIPAVNVIVLDNVPNKDPITVQDFRDKILAPLLSQISARRLHPQIDYVIYSTDFPSAVGVKGDTDKVTQELPKVYSKTRASITTLTYFYEFSMAGNPAYIELEANHFFRRTMEETLSPPELLRPDPQLEAAISTWESANYERALEAFEELAKESKGRPSLLYWQARCQAKLGKLDEARKLLEEVADAGWAFRDDTLIDPAFSTVRDADWFQELGRRLPPCPPGSRPTVGFNARTRWTRDGLNADDPKIANRYLISSVLAYTRNDMMSIDEVSRQIRRTVAADHTNPGGTVYYMRNGDIRSKTRDPNFDGAVADLKRLGIKAKVVSGVLPKNADDIVGLMTGKATFDLPASGSTIVPGAICENLTSYGGRFYNKNDPQTRLTEFLRSGAAASCGTVSEPFAIANKFPHPHIHVHYARGASLGEAFFQSVHGPYQLLVVGDPLCRPFAKPLKFNVTGLQNDQVITGPLSLSLSPADSNKNPIGRIEVYIDGLLQGNYSPDAEIELNSSDRQLTQGFHELRIVAVEESPVAVRSLKTIPFFVGAKKLIELSIKDKSSYALNGQITGTMRAPNASRLILLHNMEQLADVSAAQGQLKIDCKRLGKGPAKLQCAAIIDGKVVLSERIEVLIK